jgi:hypothetical protein
MAMPDDADVSVSDSPEERLTDLEQVGGTLQWEVHAHGAHWLNACSIAEL